jgi:hypothetical protein
MCSRNLAACLYHLEIDPDAQPVKHTPRRIAIPFKVELKAHIETLENIYGGSQETHRAN